MFLSWGSSSDLRPPCSYARCMWIRPGWMCMWGPAVRNMASVCYGLFEPCQSLLLCGPCLRLAAQISDGCGGRLQA